MTGDSMIRKTTPTPELTQQLSPISAKHAGGLQDEPYGAQIALAQACLRGVSQTATEWVDACCRAKELEPGNRRGPRRYYSAQ